MDVQGFHAFLFVLCKYSLAATSSINLALHKPVSKSHGTRSANLTVDGDVRRSSPYCYFSDYSNYPWLRVDLGQTYSVSRVAIYGHSGGLKYPSHNLNGVKIYMHNDEQSKGTYQHQIPASPQIRMYNFTLISPVDARYITLQHGEKKNLAVCELEIYKEECDHGQFGPICTEACHCMDNKTCDHVTGICSNGLCDFGWTGGSCDVKCVSNRFGHNCHGTCYCLDNVPCDHVTGVCPRGLCSSGWFGTSCHISKNQALGKLVQLSTETGFEGWEAEKAVDGFLPTLTNTHTCRCCASTQTQLDPWLRLDLNGTYLIFEVIIQGRLDGVGDGLRDIAVFLHKLENDIGEEFKPTQRNMTYIDVRLNRPVFTHYVTLVQRGYKMLIVCELEVLTGDCWTGTFGRQCEHACHCVEGPCDRTSGACLSGLCQPGYAGVSCNKTVTVDEKQSLPVAAIAGGTTGFLMCVCLAVVIVYCLRKSAIKRGIATYEETDMATRQQDVTENYSTLQEQNMYDFVSESTIQPTK